MVNVNLFKKLVFCCPFLNRIHMRTFLSKLEHILKKRDIVFNHLITKLVNVLNSSFLKSFFVSFVQTNRLLNAIVPIWNSIIPILLFIIPILIFIIPISATIPILNASIPILNGKRYSYDQGCYFSDFWVVNPNYRHK